MDEKDISSETFENVTVSDKAHELLTTKEEREGEELAESERQLSLWKAAVHHKRIVFHVLAACTAGMVFGYDSIANGASISMPGFLIYFGAFTAKGEAYLPSIWTSLWTSMSNLFQALGGFFIGFVTDRLGRKWPCVAASGLSLIGVGVQHAATTRGMLLGGKMINGFAIGCLLATATAWAAEISPTRLRAPIQSGIVLLTIFTQALGLGVIRIFVPNITPHSFRTVFAIQFAFAALSGILFVFMPESPTWLIIKGRHEAAKTALTRLHGSRNNIPARYAHLAKAIRLEAEEAHHHGAGSYIEAFRGSNLKRTLTVMWMFIGFGLSGACLLSQSIYFLIIAGLPAIHSYDVAIGGFALAMVFVVASWFYMEKVGRRSLFLAGAAVNAIAMLVIGALYYSHKTAVLWAVAIIMNVLIAWQNVSLVSTSWAITGDISAYRLRGKTQAMAVISNAFSTWFYTFTVPYIYNIDAGNLGIRAGFVYGAGSIVFLVGSYFIVPELKGFTTEEIDWLYSQKIKTWRFQEYADGRVAEGLKQAAERQSV